MYSFLFSLHIQVEVQSNEELYQLDFKKIANDADFK